MAEAGTPRPGRGWARWIGHELAEGIRRIYAIGVILLVGWLSYVALRYLVVTLMFPSPVPGQIAGVPRRLTADVLATRRGDWLGLQANQNPRTPAAHYHQIGDWVRPDRFNTCTQSGCHAPVPHAARKELRAFLNLHATSMHCGVCHVEPGPAGIRTTWYSLDTGRAQAAPATLQLYGWLTAPESAAELARPTPATQRHFVTLLRAAAAAADDTPALTALAAEAAAVRYDSPSLQRTLEAARRILPRHFRGEYGAKLALRDPQSGRPLLRPAELGDARTPDAVRAYLAEFGGGRMGSGERRRQLLDAIHPRPRAAALHCTDCHRTEAPALDFAAAGYPAARIALLSQPVVFQMIERIASGQPFYLPGFLPPSDSPSPAPGPEPAHP